MAESSGERSPWRRVRGPLAALLAGVVALSAWIAYASDPTPLQRAQALEWRYRSRPTSDLQTTIVDAASAPEQRLAALRVLRGRATGAVDPRDVPALVAALAGLARTSPDADVRADVLRQLDGVRDPALRDPLLEALEHDTSWGVRSEAAETLAGYLDDPDVRAALERAAAQDVNASVRHEAARSLGEAPAFSDGR